MAVWSEVKNSDIEHKRIDSEFYQPTFLDARNKVGNKKLSSYGAVVQHPAEVKRVYSDSGLHIVLAQNNRDNFYNWAEQRHMPVKMMQALERNKLEMSDVTVTRSGANYGQTSVITIEPETSSLYACADLLVIKPGKISGCLLSTYLNTTYGKRLMLRGVYGAGQPHVAPNYVREIPFPECLQSHSEEIHDLIIKSRKIEASSQSLYTQAQQLLEQELGLDKLTFEKPVGYEARFSEAAVSARFDSEHYFPEFNSFINNLPKRIKLVPLAQLLNFCQRGKQPIYSKSGARVINSKHILNNKIVTEGNRYAKLNSVAQFNISHGDTLINGTGRGTIGRSAAYLETELAVPDNHVTILRTNVLDPVYLANFLNSKAGQLQVEKHQRGSSGQLELYPFDIRKFLVWDAPVSFQKEIRQLHEKAFSAEKESKSLLEQAKSRVESLIEEAAAK